MSSVSTKRGFTLVEIMIVVAIIGVLAAIAIPAFTQARETTRENACINNLRQIDSAKEQWAMAEDEADGAAVTFADIEDYIRGGEPNCPSGGDYATNDVGADPTCTIAGHELD